MNRIKPELAFTPKLKELFPNDTILVEKHGHEGQEMAKWLKKTGNEFQGIGYYRELIDGATKLLDGRKPDSVCFVWMQGESDAMAKERADVYESALKSLIALVRKDIGGESMPVVIGRINDWKNRLWNGNTFAEWERIRAIQVNLASTDPHAAWVDTDDLNDPADDAHMLGKDGYLRLAKRFANASHILLNGRVPPGPVFEETVGLVPARGTPAKPR
ncbi:hypothetical protein LBMAG53_31990 [Planctomycetota bacterium]|nr:hypothetical protein LBMAG53_31990 [Planctomycetota bacterium]